jgi:hypothetical protein
MLRPPFILAQIYRHSQEVRQHCQLVGAEDKPTSLSLNFGILWESKGWVAGSQQQPGLFGFQN